MRKKMDISSDVNSSYERVILVFKIQNGWNDVIFQLIHLTGQWYHSLMNWLSSFAISSRNWCTNPCQKKCSTGRKFTSAETRQVTQQQPPQNKENREDLCPQMVDMTSELQQILFCSFIIIFMFLYTCTRSQSWHVGPPILRKADSSAAACEI